MTVIRKRLQCVCKKSNSNMPFMIFIAYFDPLKIRNTPADKGHRMIRFRKGELKVTFTRPLQLKGHL